MNRKTFLKLTPLALLAGLFLKTNPTQAAPVRPKVWAAKLTQTTTFNPVATVMANDFPFAFVFARDAIGIYSVTVPEPVFIDGKVLPTVVSGDAFTLQRAPKVSQFSNDPQLLKLFMTDFDGVYQDTWILYLKIEVYP